MVEPTEQRLQEGTITLDPIVRVYKLLFAADIIEEPPLIFVLHHPLNPGRKGGLYF